VSDVEVVMDYPHEDGIADPYALVPISARAHKLFARWGMKSKYDGVYPPENAMAFVMSVPKNWELISRDRGSAETLLLARVPLPQEIRVVH
jgi:hypothetical protein